MKVWVRTSASAEVSVAYWPAEDVEHPQCVVSAATGMDHDFTHVVALQDLEPEREYTYRVYVGDRPATSELKFRTLPPEGEPGRIRFASAADVNGGDIPGFADIEAVDPDFVLMLGDNVYADGGDASYTGYRDRYHAVWGGVQFQRLFERVASFAMWDDHELVDNYWQGKSDEVYDFGRQLYDAYQGSRNPAPLRPGALYYSFRAGEVGFFVLDTRSHRSPNRDPDTADKSMLGAEQKQALENWLIENSSQVHVIVSSVLMHRFTTTGDDSWQSFSVERASILQTIALYGTRNVLVVSGDQHWSAVLSIDHDGEEPYTVYEFQATPLGFEERVAPMTLDQTVLALDNTHQVFGVFDVDTRAEPPTIDYTLCAVGLACMPGQELPPSRDGLTRVPYSLRFVGSSRGVRRVTMLD